MVSPNLIGAIAPPGATSPASTLPSNSATMDCSGRTQVMVPLPHFIDLGQGSAFMAASMMPGSASAVGPPFLRDHGEPELALAGVALLRLVERGEAGGLQEALHRLVGRADPRSAPFLADVGPRRRQAVDHQRQPARRGEGTRVLELQPGGLQPVAHQPLEIVGGARLHARRDLFAQKFEKQLGHQAASFVWVASHASQHALARSRTRRM